MKTRRLEYACEILSEQINHWALFPAAVTIMGVTAVFTGADKPNLLLWVLCGLFPPAFFFLREKVRHLSVFFLLHMALTMLVILIPVQNLVERLLAAACGVGYLLHSIGKRLKDPEAITSAMSPIAALVISAIAIVLQHYQGNAEWDSFYVQSLVGVLALYALVSYIRHYLEFLSVNESSADYLPASDMLRSGFSLVAGYTLLGAVFLIFATGGGWVASFREALRRIVVAVLRFLVSLIPEGGQGETVLEQAAESGMSFDQAMLPENGDPFLLWKILEMVVGAAFACAMVFFAVKGLIRLVKYVLERFGAGVRRNGELAVDSELDIREKCGIDKSHQPRQKKNRLGFLSSAERVRKLYKKKVLSSASLLTGSTVGEDNGELQLLTARECAEKLKNSTMADIYEKARYSEQEITRETVRQMREACR